MANPDHGHAEEAAESDFVFVCPLEPDAPQNAPSRIRISTLPLLAALTTIFAIAVGKVILLETKRADIMQKIEEKKALTREYIRKTNSINEKFRELEEEQKQLQEKLDSLEQK